MNRDRLGVVDATYLAIEEPRIPLHVASIGVFERGPLCDKTGALRLEEIRERITSRLELLPRLRQRVVEVPFGLARPVWIDDDRFDIANHVDVVALPEPGDEQALLRLVEDLVMEPLDRGRPLWHLRFVTGLSDDRIALVERAHHAMIDGVSGVDVSLVLLDTSPDAPPDGTTTAWSPRPTPSPSALLLDGLRDRLEAPVDAAWRAALTLRHPTAVARGFAGATGSFATLRHNGVTAPRSSLNVQIGSSRRLSIVRQHLDDVKQAGKAANATVNDVVLAAVAGGLRSLLLARGESLATDQQLKILVPVSVRSSGESMSLGNRVGAMLMPLPIGIGDPASRLEAIAVATRNLKNSDEASTADFLLQAADLLPQAMARAVQRGVNHQSLVNMVVTNVPGPPFPLYAMGARMLEAFPVVPLGGNMSLEVAILSYNGALNLCVTSDRETCPDAPEFVDGLERAFAGLGASWTPELERKGGAFPLGSS